MNRFLVFLAPMVAALFLWSSQGITKTLSKISTDGCTGFINGPGRQNGSSWVHCCIEHDITYWHGGTEDQRKSSDLKLAHCVNDSLASWPKSDPQALGWIMYMGVRALGGPSCGGGYSLRAWGHGWGDFCYSELSTTAKEVVLERLKSFEADDELQEIFDRYDLDTNQQRYLKESLSQKIKIFSAPF